MSTGSTAYPETICATFTLWVSHRKSQKSRKFPVRLPRSKSEAFGGLLTAAKLKDRPPKLSEWRGFLAFMLKDAGAVDMLARIRSRSKRIRADVFSTSAPA